VLELAADLADGDNTICWALQFTDTLNSQADKRIAQFLLLRTGTTALNRGGAIAVMTRPDGGSAAVERMRITSAGNVGIGIQTPNSRFAVAGLPTSTAGLASGDVWRDAAAGNVLKIVP
jgi:hypothetical protein